MFKWFKGDRKEKNNASLWEKFQKGLSKTREKLKQGLGELFVIERIVDEAFFEKLEEELILADINIETVQKLLSPLRLKVKKEELLKAPEVKQVLKQEMLKILDLSCPPFPPEPSPSIIFLIGVNGVGKTTTLAKLAYILKQQDKKVLAVAADTFRAAAIEQLEIWTQRLEIPLIKQTPGTDPSAVVFEGTKAAQKRGIDVALVDTAGRLHTKYNLMEELKKMARVAGKIISEAPHESFLVIDATTGQNAINQVRLFNQALPISGLILTKMDGTAKGGIALSLTHLFKIPIRFIGLGEKIEDLQRFEPKAFIEAILP